MKRVSHSKNKMKSQECSDKKHTERSQKPIKYGVAMGSIPNNYEAGNMKMEPEVQKCQREKVTLTQKRI